MHPVAKTGVFLGVLVVLAIAGALEWYAHAFPGRASAQPFPMQNGTPKNVQPVASNAPQPPSATATPATTYGSVAPSASPITLSPNAPPQILAMSLSTPVASAGQVVSGTVQTSSNVASVEARVGDYSASLTKTGVGTFHLSYQVPKLPAFLHNRTYAIDVIARNTAGVAVHSSMPITIK